LRSKAAAKNGAAVEPKPTKHFIAFLVADLSLLAGVEAELSSKLGEIDARGTSMARSIYVDQLRRSDAPTSRS